MRLLALAVAALVLAACGSDGPSQNGLASLTVKVDADGTRGAQPAKELKLDCASARDSSACGAAAAVTSQDLAPVPSGMMCTQIYGGPETAEITGTLRGKPVQASYNRTDGCQIKRWKGVQPLLDQVR